MNLTKIFIVSVFALVLCILPLQSSNAGGSFAILKNDTLLTTDNASSPFLFYFFDLRDRETFIQITFSDDLQSNLSGNVHIQIFDVSNNCNENNFFDLYTDNDTHVYNMRDIQTNDGNPSGVVLPDGAYGIVTAFVTPVPFQQSAVLFFGNLRIIDDNGYEYRTNAAKIIDSFVTDSNDPNEFYTFNFNQEGGVILSDIVGITIRFESFDPPEFAADPLSVFNTFDVDIYDLNEVPFSCRDVIFACINQESNRLESLLEFAGTANVADFEYGINNAIPHSKGGELLCPGNNVGNGTVVLSSEFQPIINAEIAPGFIIFIGLNNGNDRGSLDTIWSFFTDIQIFN